MEELLGDGIFITDGEMWKQQRKLSSLEFASRNLRDFSTTVFRDYALNLSGILQSSSIYNEQIDMQVGFGVEIGTLAYELPDNRFANAFEYASSTVTYRFVNPLWRFKRFLNVGSEALFVQSIQVIDEFTYKLIHKRKAELQKAVQEAKSTSNNVYKLKHDLLSRFIELSENPHSNLTDKILRDVIINFVLAGRDTTAATLSRSIYMLMINPNIAEHIYTELITFEENEVKEMTGYDPEHQKSFAEKITQFASLLTYDPKGILEDDVLPDGTKVRAGGLMITVPYVMGRVVYNWGPDATSFNPGRWLNEEGIFQSACPFKFTAFQAGPRTCLGKDSAYLQMKMTLAILCRFFNFHLTPNHPVKYTMMPSLTMEHGLKLTVTTR
ncbi:hypothetical protein MKW98_018893 [Papaver atlanticum]|uniref:Cytochrome P450 n=1 Tax=Papaver atlanticum TaxID=357466 RepID=A0AAD4TIK4_9MAGN|nr:hypothetical protein MKW98_018893 [Papaver atlanticum]